MAGTPRNRVKTPRRSDQRPALPSGAASVSRLEAWILGGATALFVLRPLYPSESVAVEGDGLPVAILWLVLFTVWGVALVRCAPAPLRFGWPDLAVGLLAAWYAVASLWAFVHESPRPALNMLWEWLGLAAAFFIARQVYRSGLQRRSVTAVMVATATAVSAYGLYQYFIELPATRAMYEHSSDEMLKQIGLWFAPGTPEREVFEQRLASLEPLATFALTNSLAGFLAPWSVVVLGILVAFGSRLSRKRGLVVASLLIPLGLCLLLTKSRGAYLALMAGLLALGGFWCLARSGTPLARRSLGTLALGLLLIAAAAVGAAAVGGLDVEILSEAPKSLGYRMQYWRSTWAMIGDAPLVGCGPGNFQARYTAYKLPEASEEIADPHNFALEIWATAGTPAIVLFLAALAASAACALRNRRPDRGEAEPAEPPPNRAAPGPAPAAADDAYAGGSARPVYLGALAGLLLLIPIGAVSAAPPGWVVPLLGLIVGAGVLAALRPWVEKGDDRGWLWMLAGGTLLVHLLFAGGISYPGVAASLWLLLALALNSWECGGRTASRRTGYAAAVLGAILVAACYLSGYGPALGVRAAMHKAYDRPTQAEEALRAAMAADPWAVVPRRHMADLAFQDWRREPTEQRLARFDHFVRETVELAPRAAGLRQGFGQQYLEAYSLSGNLEHLAKGIEALQAAARLYPNHARIRADLAQAHGLAGNQAEYQRERSAALSLDRLTPHLDKKLSDEQRNRLERNDPG